MMDEPDTEEPEGTTTGETLPAPPLKETSEAISKAAIALLLKEPFFAHILGNLPRILTDQTPTAAVAWDGSRITLLVNPNFFYTEINEAVIPFHQTSARAAILKHEVLHIVFRHLFRKKGNIPEIENIAADLVVNQYIGEWHVDESSLVNIIDYADLDIEHEESVDYYYGKLISLYRELLENGLVLPPDVLGRQGKAEIPEGSEKNWTESKQIRQIAAKTSAPISAENLGKVLISMRLRSLLSGDHSFWSKDGSAGKYIAGTLVLRATKRLTSAQWGSLPSYLRTAIGLIKDGRNSALDWKHLLRIFCAQSYKTQIRHTLKRKSKRFGTHPGIKVRRFSNLLVAVDTSGSIDQWTMESFFEEIDAIHISGASITILECDAEVHRTYPYEGKPPAHVEGNGGTDFEPVFQWMQDRPPYDGMVYLTDGYAGTPETQPNCRMMWVIPTHCRQDDQTLPFGPTIWIPSKEDSWN